jgi:hypothetical protein
MNDCHTVPTVPKDGGRRDRPLRAGSPGRAVHAGGGDGAQLPLPLASDDLDAEGDGLTVADIARAYGHGRRPRRNRAAADGGNFRPPDSGSTSGRAATRSLGRHGGPRRDSTSRGRS